MEEFYAEVKDCEIPLWFRPIHTGNRSGVVSFNHYDQRRTFLTVAEKKW
jgi:hypothetical protein